VRATHRACPDLAHVSLGSSVTRGVGGSSGHGHTIGYAAAAEIASLVVRLDQAWGFVALVLVLLVVWVTDIGGYFAGRGMGGPKLWPRVSPKKTWSGAIGGAFGAVVVALAFARQAHLTNSLAIVCLALLLSTVSQAGDLFESAFKRRFGCPPSVWRVRRATPG